MTHEGWSMPACIALSQDAPCGRRIAWFSSGRSEGHQVSLYLRPKPGHQVSPMAQELSLCAWAHLVNLAQAGAGAVSFVAPLSGGELQEGRRYTRIHECSWATTALSIGKSDETQSREIRLGYQPQLSSEELE